MRRSASINTGDSSPAHWWLSIVAIITTSATLANKDDASDVGGEDDGVVTGKTPGGGDGVVLGVAPGGSGGGGAVVATPHVVAEKVGRDETFAAYSEKVVCEAIVVVVGQVMLLGFCDSRRPPGPPPPGPPPPGPPPPPPGGPVVEESQLWSARR